MTHHRAYLQLGHPGRNLKKFPKKKQTENTKKQAKKNNCVTKKKNIKRPKKQNKKGQALQTIFKISCNDYIDPETVSSVSNTNKIKYYFIKHSNGNALNTNTPLNNELSLTFGKSGKQYISAIIIDIYGGYICKTIAVNVTSLSPNINISNSVKSYLNDSEGLNNVGLALIDMLDEYNITDSNKLGAANLIAKRGIDRYNK